MKLPIRKSPKDLKKQKKNRYETTIHKRVIKDMDVQFHLQSERHKFTYIPTKILKK